MQSGIKTILAIAMPLALTGCADPATITLGSASVVSVIDFGKTV
tara:strand:+ start:193 stop:324 length:132 start_codon:yes stop_codon:yes gene_type:complete